MYCFYRRRSVLPQDLARAQEAAGGAAEAGPAEAGPAEAGPVEAEHCFYVQTAEPLDEAQEKTLRWLLAETFDPDGLAATTFLTAAASILEIGPRINFETAWSSTARNICHVNGLDTILRLERSRRFGFARPLSGEQLAQVAEPLHDRMTETIYPAPLATFETGLTPEPVRTIPLAQGGLEALRAVNRELGLAMDEADLDRFYRLFTEQLHRDPTDVELFQLAQGNSEHCRHGFFTGRMTIDGEVQPGSLMAIVKEPWRRNPGNSLIAFGDDSSAIRGGPITAFTPAVPGRPSPLREHQRIYHPTLTAETHNHPSGVAPYPGAATGTGGRIRDNQVVGRGGLVQVSGAAYCVGNLDLHAWEAGDGDDPAHPRHPDNLAAPLDILIQASNGASDYGNCFGEPLIYGFVRTYGAHAPDGSYRSWFKPIMYSTGAGQLDDAHVGKQPAEPGLLVVQLGGPAYRIGLGGGAASSMMSGENEASLDFNSVQRGDPELEQRLGRVLRACIELGDENPIVSAHDLGAGGDCNALPEIVYPAGARIDLRAIPVGDASLSVLEIWGNESQERNAILVRPGDLDALIKIADREKTPLAVVGEVTGDGRLSLQDSVDGSVPVDLPLEPVLGKVAPKELQLRTVPEVQAPLSLDGVSIDESLDRVLRLPCVASKSYLTRKVDRCVTGHVAQQQCVGPNQLPLSDYAVYAQSLLGVSGVALSLGEQPIKGLVDPAAMARMAVAEALLNLAGAKITQLPDIRCSANWMWAAKLPGEGARLRQAALAMSEIMIELGMAVDGGKDSLSMAVSGDQPVKAPGQLVISAYAPMPDVRVKVTPDLKTPGNALILVDPSGGQARLGGSALAQVWHQLGDQTPDVDDVTILRKAFDSIQNLIAAGHVASAHDRSDGGLITAVLEMAFAGNTGVELDLGLDLGLGLAGAAGPLAVLFAEELGVVLETADADATLDTLSAAGVPATVIGQVGGPGGQVVARVGGQVVIDRPMTDLRAVWEDTSTRIDRLQADPESVDEEHRATRDLVTAPDWHLTYAPTAPTTRSAGPRPRVAILRDQGSNGDRELAAAFHAAGFEAWDVTMTDLLDGRTSLEEFRGVAFPGGFSYGDVLDAGKAWAGVIRGHSDLAGQFDAFYRRPDTFSLGVCNGAQLMALLGWAPGMTDERRPRFIRNRSGRFECRLATVEVAPSPSIFLRGMEGSRLGVWVAHGEGRLHLPAGAVDPSLVPLRFADPDGKPTERYPFNPNGSPGGATALTSPDGRHLAMMPHPERMANQLWQWPWLPPAWKDLPASPWLRMFQNAYDWCCLD